jgi:hypothetical protein
MGGHFTVLASLFLRHDHGPLRVTVGKTGDVVTPVPMLFYLGFGYLLNKSGQVSMCGSPFQFSCSKPSPDRLWGFARGYDDDPPWWIDGALWLREVNAKVGVY